MAKKSSRKAVRKPARKVNKPIAKARKGTAAKVKPKQAIHMAEALVRGEKHGADIIKTIFGDKIRELV